ncbi:MAG: hypothetical protein M1280_06020, partial [Actinobacteria bacterium]|nr:hypothetical protein [Actinomycetota bacterium]
ELSDELTATTHGRTPSKPRHILVDVGGVLVNCPNTDSQCPVPVDGLGRLSDWRAKGKGVPRGRYVIYKINH